MPRNTKTFLGNEVKEKILQGVREISEPLKLTLGPQAGTALMYRTYARGPRIVDDGHTIAQVIEPKDEAVRLVAQAFKEATEQTNKKAGDGTTGTTVVASQIIEEVLGGSGTVFQSASKNRLSVQKTKKELLALSKQIQEKVKEKAKKVESLEELEKIAFVSLGDEKLGKIVADMVWKVGVDGHIDVVDGYKGEIETEVIEGARFPAKIAAKYTINNPKKFEMVVEDIAVILTNYKLDNVKQVDQMLGNVLKGNKKLVILAPDFSELVLQGMFQIMFAPLREGGFARTGTDIYPVKVPSLRTEQFEDLETYFGANFINKNTGKKLENITDQDLGFVEKLVVKDTENREDAIAIGGKGTREAQMKVGSKDYQVSSPVAERIAVLKSQVIEERQDMNKKLLERRIASLASAVGVVRVGASTSAEALPLKLKIEDAQYACKSALEEGYVKGGGLCLKEIAEELPESLATKALKAPYQQIQDNNDGELEIGEDIIDPAKVVRLIIDNAFSVAANLITCKIIIPELDEPNPADGYQEIAKALRVMNAIEAKKNGILKENLDMMEQDHQKILDTVDDKE